MPDWTEVLEEINQSNRIDALDYVRRKYLSQLYDLTGRNVIAYYSGWLQKNGLPSQGSDILAINDADKNGLMTVIHGLDRKKGLDLILHTPGGNVAATESIVDYLRKMFGPDIRAIVPQLSMSAGTMICCASKEIIMGKQSSLGPIDPQFGGISAHGVLEEFNDAIEATKKNPDSLPIWAIIISQYSPTFIGDCEKAIALASELVKSWLISGMFKSESNSEDIANKIVSELNNHNKTKTHARHIPIDECQRLGLKIKQMESDQDLQDVILTINHAYMHTFSQSTSVKIIENHLGKAMVQHIQASQ